MRFEECWVNTDSGLCLNVNDIWPLLMLCYWGKDATIDLPLYSGRAPRHFQHLSDACTHGQGSVAGFGFLLLVTMLLRAQEPCQEIKLAMLSRCLCSAKCLLYLLWISFKGVTITSLPHYPEVDHSSGKRPVRHQMFIGYFKIRARETTWSDAVAPLTQIFLSI